MGHELHFQKEIFFPSNGNFQKRLVAIQNNGRCLLTLICILILSCFSAAACHVECYPVNGTCANGNKGSISLAVFDAVAPYTYTWSNGATTSSLSNLPAGTYTVTVKDKNQNTATCTATITTESCNQCSLYEENFSYSDGTQSNANWTIDVSATGSNDYFAVNSNRWKGNDLDGDAYWKSLVVNIAGKGAVTASLEIEGTGDMESDDYIKVYYILDGGSPVLFETNGEKHDAFSLTTATHDGLVGSTLQIKVQMKNTSSDEKHYLDKVKISGSCCDAEIDDVIIYNLSNGTSFDVIQDGEIYTLGSLPSSWNIEAFVSGSTAQSVQFTWSGDYAASNIENISPYRSTNDNTALNLGIGDYTLVVKLYSEDGAGGTTCDEKELHFSIVPDCDADIDDVIIYNLSSGTTFDVIQDGETYTLGSLPSSWNIEALVSGSTAQSVEFIWSGGYTTSNIENTAPFRAPTDNVTLNLGIGNYTLLVKLYSEDGAAGSKCDEKELHFSIVPTCDANIDNVIIYNLSNGTSFDAIQDGETYSLGSLPSSWNIEALVSGSTAQSVEFTWSGAYTASHIENTYPFRSPTDNVSLNLGIGNYTLLVKLFSEDGAGGSKCDETTLHFSIAPTCQMNVDATPEQQICNQFPTTITATVSGASECTVPGTSDCNHVLANSGGWLENTTASTVCGDNSGTKLYTQSGEGTSYITLDLGSVVPAGTSTCASMKLEHCNNSATSYSNAQISSSLNATTGFVTVVSSVTFSQTSYMEFCYTLADSARYIKVADNGNCAFRVDYVKYTTQTVNNGGLTYQWSGPGITGSTNQATVTVNAAGTYTVLVTDCKGCTATATEVIAQPVPLSVSGTVINVSITNGSNGSIDVTATGGTPPYSYLWNDGAITQDRSGLTAGTYTVTVTDSKSCSKGEAFIVNQPNCSLGMTGSPLNITCHDYKNGSINITVTGAQGAVTYLWNDGSTAEDRSGLAPGTYTVTATDAAGCKKTEAFTISEPGTLQASGAVINEATVNGGDGSINLTVSGGTSPYTYLWSDGSTAEDRTNLAAGTYSVTVTDAHGCGTNASFEIKDYVCSLTVVANPDDDKCKGEDYLLSAVASDPNATYSWAPQTGLDNPNIANPITSVKNPTTYTVTVTGADGCTASDEVTVTISPTVKAKVTVVASDASCGEPCVKLSTPYNADWTYKWKLDGKNAPAPNTANTYCACESGVYSVKVTDIITGCKHNSKKYTVTITQKMEAGQAIEENADIHFSAWPNPATEVLNVTIYNRQAGATTIQLVDMFGRTLNTVDAGDKNADQTITFNVKDLSAGVYFVRMQCGNSKEVQKVILTR